MCPPILPYSGVGVKVGEGGGGKQVQDPALECTGRDTVGQVASAGVEPLQSIARGQLPKSSRCEGALSGKILKKLRIWSRCAIMIDNGG